MVLIQRARTNISPKAKLTNDVWNINYPFYVGQDPDDAVEAHDVANSTARLVFHALLGKKGMGKGCAITIAVAGREEGTAVLFKMRVSICINEAPLK